MTLDEKLTSIFQSRGKHKEKLDWLCGNEDIQLVWSMVSTLADDNLEEELLKEIASLWITTRGYSKALKIKEDYKKDKATSTKGKRSLRKELKRKEDESNNNIRTHSIFSNHSQTTIPILKSFLENAQAIRVQRSLAIGSSRNVKKRRILKS